ncbi:MAG: hypothetical protein ACJATA_000329 [Sphingobacteriales bacterium]|jgi:hypothetical protein
MESNKNNNYSFNIVTLLDFVWKYKIQLIVVTLLAGISSIIFSGPAFITPKFKSTLIFYPTATTSVSGALLDEGGNKKDVLAFGEKEQVDQILQILGSGEIKNRVISDFNLVAHYDIDTTKKEFKTNVSETFNKNITYKRTEYNAIQVKVLDSDPQVAADIANFIGEMLDTTKNRIQKIRALEAFNIVKAEYTARVGNINQLNDSLNALRNIGIYDYESQSAIINDQFIKALANTQDEQAKLKTYKEYKGNVPDSLILGTTARLNGALAKKKELENKLNLLAKYGGKYIYFSNQMDLEQQNLSELKLKLDKATIDYEKTLPQKFIINKAEVSEIKATPVRSVIVFGTTFSVFFLSLILLFISDYLREYFKNLK